MAQQKSIFKLRGNIAGVSFYKSQDGYLAREKGGVEGQRIAKDAAFQRTRENMAEFGDAAKSGGLFRSAFRSQILHSTDARATGRLMGAMLRVVKTDFESPRGERQVALGTADLLEGFDFNIKAPLNSTLYAAYVIQADRALGAAGIHLPSFIPDEGLTLPSGVTHFRLTSGCAIIDFSSRVFESVFAQSAMIPVNIPATEIIDLNHVVSGGSTLPMFITLGVQFFQEVNGQHYPLKNGVYNALAVVKMV